MKKLIVLVFMLLALLSSAYAISEIEYVVDNSITFNNGICEIYEHDFAVSEIDTFYFNNRPISIELQSLVGDDAMWVFDGFAVPLNNHAFFYSHADEFYHPLRRFYVGSSTRMSFSELDMIPHDCLGWSGFTGLVKLLDLEPGWNLVPAYLSFRDCYFAQEGEICKDDLLAEFYYVPAENRFYSQEELEEAEQNGELSSSVSDYFNDNIFSGSNWIAKWVYLGDSVQGKWYKKDFCCYIPYREKYLNPQHDGDKFSLKAGWNLVFVDGFMVFDDEWNFNPLSWNDMRGDCLISNAYTFDTSNNQWNRKSLVNSFTYEEVGLGQALKVVNDCVLGTPQ